MPQFLHNCLSGLFERVKWETSSKPLVQNPHPVAILIIILLVNIPPVIPIKLKAPWIVGNQLCIPGTMLSMCHFQEPNLGYFHPKP